MSFFREQVLTKIAEYCRDNTNIDPWDAVAYFASASIPSWKGQKQADAIDSVASEFIKTIKSMPEEYFEGEYSKVSQDRWDGGSKGRSFLGDKNEGIARPHYYCSKICPNL